MLTDAWKKLIQGYARFRTGKEGTHLPAGSRRQGVVQKYQDQGSEVGGSAYESFINQSMLNMMKSVVK